MQLIVRSTAQRQRIWLTFFIQSLTSLLMLSTFVHVFTLSHLFQCIIGFENSHLLQPPFTGLHTSIRTWVNGTLDKRFYKILQLHISKLYVDVLGTRCIGSHIGEVDFCLHCRRKLNLGSLVHGLAVCLIRSSTRFSSCTYPSYMLMCLGPDASAVI
jgi:hypothetical protein